MKISIFRFHDPHSGTQELEKSSKPNFSNPRNPTVLVLLIPDRFKIASYVSEPAPNRRAPSRIHFWVFNCGGIYTTASQLILSARIIDLAL